MFSLFFNYNFMFILIKYFGWLDTSDEWKLVSPLVCDDVENVAWTLTDYFYKSKSNIIQTELISVTRMLKYISQL